MPEFRKIVIPLSPEEQKKHDAAVRASLEAGTLHARQFGRIQWNWDDWNAVCEAYYILIGEKNEVS